MLSIPITTLKGDEDAERKEEETQSSACVSSVLSNALELGRHWACGASASTTALGGSRTIAWWLALVRSWETAVVSLQPPVLGWASYWNEDLFDGSDFDLLVEPLAVLATAGVVLAGALPLVWPLCPSSSEDDAVKSMSTALGLLALTTGLAAGFSMPTLS